MHVAVFKHTSYLFFSSVVYGLFILFSPLFAQLPQMGWRAAVFCTLNDTTALSQNSFTISKQTLVTVVLGWLRAVFTSTSVCCKENVTHQTMMEEAGAEISMTPMLEGWWSQMKQDL